jgi:hypothetical protein
MADFVHTEEYDARVMEDLAISSDTIQEGESTKAHFQRELFPATDNTIVPVNLIDDTLQSWMAR